MDFDVLVVDRRRPRRSHSEKQMKIWSSDLCAFCPLVSYPLQYFFQLHLPSFSLNHFCSVVQPHEAGLSASPVTELYGWKKVRTICNLVWSKKVSLTRNNRTSNPLYDPATFNDALRRRNLMHATPQTSVNNPSI